MVVCALPERRVRFRSGGLRRAAIEKVGEKEGEIRVLLLSDFATTSDDEASKEKLYHFQGVLGKLSGDTCFTSRSRSVHPNSLDFLVLHRLSILEILQLELFLIPKVRDLLGVGHSDSATTSESGPLGSTLESQLGPDAVDSGDESRKLLGSVKRRRSDTETLLADRNGREV